MTIPAKKTMPEDARGSAKLRNLYYGGLSRTTLYAAIGNVVEFYDFTLFAFLMPVVTAVFFPQDRSVSPMLMGILTFGVSFFARPLGALFFGRIGDLYDRSYGFVLSLMFMVVATLGLALLPTYESWGMASSYFLVALRILQAFSAGGEYSGAAILAVENTPRHYQYVAGVAIVTSSIFGMLLALGVAQVLLSYGEDSFLWRLGFALGALNSLVAFAVRRKMRKGMRLVESQRKDTSVNKQHTRGAYGTKTWWCSFFVAGFSGLFFYTGFSFVGNYMLMVQKWSLADVNLLNALGMLMSVATLAFMAPIYQRWGGRLVMLWGCLGLLILGIPAFLLTMSAQSFGAALIPHLLFSACFIAAQGGLHGLFVPAFAESHRFRAYGLGYGMGLAVFGGTANYALLVLQSHFAEGRGVFVYLTIMTIVAMICLFFMKAPRKSSGEHTNVHVLDLKQPLL